MTFEQAMLKAHRIGLMRASIMRDVQCQRGRSMGVSCGWMRIDILT
jgi:hypothetical protein